MSNDQSHLYGVKRASKSSSSSSAPATASNSNFSTALSSLIAASSSSASKPGRARAAKPNKIDIAELQRQAKSRPDASTTHSNKDAKRTRTSDPLEEDDYRRSKRKMEEKARIYAALKRGDIEDDSEKHMVDFDRKWAERHPGSADSDLTSSSSEDEQEGDIEKVEYIDELGRTRIGSSLNARRADRIKAGLEEQQATARPAQPTQLIYGDTVQHQAFDLDAPAAERMAELAAKRDRELTPPEAVHYDASKEVRTKGTGFFQFSKDEELREEQLRDLEREREETELQRREKEVEQEAKRAKRRRDIEERRKLVNTKRSGAKADRFLAELSSEVPASAQDADVQNEDKS